MCRAFVGIKLGDEEEYDQHLRSIMFKYMKSGHDSGNKEGYVFASHPMEGKINTIRSLDYQEAMLGFLDLKTDHVIHGHARKASRGDTKTEFIHGWKFKNWICSMNGTIHFNKGFDMKPDENDSLHFFKMAFNEDNFSEDVEQWAKNIKKLAEDSIDYGNGILFFTSKEHTLVLSLNKKLHAHFLNRRLLIFNSNDDVHKLYPTSIDIKTGEEVEEEVVKLGKLQFGSTRKKEEVITIDVDTPTFEDLKTDMEDVIIVVDNSNGEVTFQEDVKPPFRTQTTSGGYSAPYSKKGKQRGSSAANPGKPASGRDKGKGYDTLDDLSGKYTDWKTSLSEGSDNSNDSTNEEPGSGVRELSEDEMDAYEAYKNHPFMGGDDNNEAKKKFAAEMIANGEWI